MIGWSQIQHKAVPESTKLNAQLSWVEQRHFDYLGKQSRYKYHATQVSNANTGLSREVDWNIGSHAADNPNGLAGGCAYRQPSITDAKTQPYGGLYLF